MNCERCGCELEEDAFFCDVCGARVGAGYIGASSEHIADLPVLSLPEEGMTVDMPHLPFIPPLGASVVVGLAVIGIAAAVIAIAFVGWVLLPQMFAAVA